MAISKEINEEFDKKKKQNKTDDHTIEKLVLDSSGPSPKKNEGIKV